MEEQSPVRAGVAAATRQGPAEPAGLEKRRRRVEWMMEEMERKRKEPGKVGQRNKNKNKKMN
jgi:hypothetical protein